MANRVKHHSPHMPQLTEIIRCLDTLLTPERYQDYGPNGIQVESFQNEISIIAFAVDSGESIIEQAILKKANLLIVHHGLFWGREMVLTGSFGRKVSLLMRNGCSLYASHLPLDGNSAVGNGFELGRCLGIQDLTGFYEYEGMTVGTSGNLPTPQKLDYFVSRAKDIPSAGTPLTLPFGKESISSVAIVTGSGSSALRAASEQGFDLLISGEPKHEAYHTAKELGMNAIFYGHYATETFGVRALERRLRKDFGVETFFIDEPTGI